MTHNVHITTSGHFNTGSLKCAIGEMGVDRIMYAIDYPCMTFILSALILDEDFEPGAIWFDGLTDNEIPEKDRVAIARNNAIKLFKLQKLLGSS
jgi:gamma-resorcylate decarboxylase